MGDVELVSQILNQTLSLVNLSLGICLELDIYPQTVENINHATTC